MLASRVVTGTALRRCSSQVNKIVLSQCRDFSPSANLASDLPYHIVVGMPALSPTMETGILAEWYLSEGAEFSAGQAIAKIETDKASIDFEAQDDGFVAKILMEAGNGDDIAVGTPIMVTVEEADDVAVFANFVVEESSSASEPTGAALEPAAAASPEPAPAKVEAVAPASPLVPAPAPPTPNPAAAVPPPAMEDMVAAVAPAMSTGWGDFVKLNSPILRTLSKQQTVYVEKYGTTGQVPL